MADRNIIRKSDRIDQILTGSILRKSADINSFMAVPHYTWQIRRCSPASKKWDTNPIHVAGVPFNLFQTQSATRSDQLGVPRYRVMCLTDTDVAVPVIGHDIQITKDGLIASLKTDTPAPLFPLPFMSVISMTEF